MLVSKVVLQDLLKEPKRSFNHIDKVSGRKRGRYTSIKHHYYFQEKKIGFFMLYAFTTISIATMFTSHTTLLPVEILVQTILNEYLTSSYCLTFVTEIPFEFNFPISFTYICPNSTDFVGQLLNVSEMGCSDYIVRMKDPEKFMKALDKVNRLGNTRRSDRKIIILPFINNLNTTKAILELLSLKETDFVANILLITHSAEETPECESYDLVTHKYVGQDAEIDQPYYLDRWNSCSAEFDMHVNLFPHDIKNLCGKTVKVAAFTYKPYVLLDLDTAISPQGRDGTEMKIIEEFCRWVNCTIEVVRDDDNEWGEIYENQTGVGVMGNVVEGRADLGIAALYSWYDSYVHLDFSAASIRTAITCIAPAPRLLASWELPFLPFSWYMWLGVCLTFLYASIALTLATGCSTNSTFLSTFGMLISQTQNDTGDSWRVRSVTGWLLVTGLILDNAYGAGLASTYTVPKYEQSIDTVQDVVDKRIEWGATHDAWIFSLSPSPEPLVKQLVSQFRTYKANELKQKTFTRSMAFSVEKLPAGYFAIGEYITEEAVLNLMLMVEDFYYEQCVVMLRKSSPYTAKISELIGRLHESGLMIAWETQVALKHLNYKVQLEVKLSRSKKDVDVAPLSLRHVEGIFFIYTTGVIISFVIFVIELIVNRGIRKTKAEDNVPVSRYIGNRNGIGWNLMAFSVPTQK